MIQNRDNRRPSSRDGTRRRSYSSSESHRTRTAPVRPHTPSQQSSGRYARPNTPTHTHVTDATKSNIQSRPQRPRGASNATRSHTARKRQMGQRRMPPLKMTKKYDDVVPPIGESIRIIPLGGVEEVGKNMIVVEYKDDLIVIDAGFQFVTEEDTPGIDYILPNTKYIEERKKKVRAVLITHGHLDHIGGIPYMMEKIGNPPIYTRELTSLMIKKRQSEFPHLPELDIRIVKPGDKITFGDLPVEFFPMTHSIPDSMGISIKTPYGNIVLTGDLKLNHVDGEPTEEEKRNWGAVGAQNNLMLISDSTNVENPGFSIPEPEIHKNLEKIIKEVTGRLIIGTFASQFERMIKIIEIAEKYNKKIVTEGRSIKTNIEIAQMAGLLKPKKGSIIPAQDIDKYPAHRIIILATGAQGEEFAALMRISTKNHKYIRFTERDTVILSSSIVPGNEMNVRKLQDNLYRHNLKVIHYKVSDVHSTGHGNAGELLWINKQVGAKYFMPGYGYHSMLKVHKQLIADAGFPKENIMVPEGNGSIIELQDGGKKMVEIKEKAPSNIIMVDGLSIGDVQEVVIRDRKMLAQDGMFVIIATINVKTGKLRKSPDIISRGFVYLRESQELLQETRNLIRKTVENAIVGMNPVNFDYVKGILTDEVSLFLFQKTNKRPLVIPVMLGV